MNKRLTILAAVAAAILIVLWLKSKSGLESTAPKALALVPPAGPEQIHSSTVLLFADPREAEESCGCAEIIRLVRGLRDAPGVLVREIDTRQPGEEARRYEVRVSPSVLIIDAAGEVRARFEGESPAVIQSLGTALDDLRRTSISTASGRSQ